MNSQDAIEYHSIRAKKELDLGLTASALVVSRAHMKLAELHMQRLRDLSGRTELHKPLLTM
jgi:hypothetical protein